MYELREQIILEAIQSLKRNKNIFVVIKQVFSCTDPNHTIVVFDTDFGEDFEADFAEDVFEAPRKDSEPVGISLPEIVLLRVARIIFDLYNLTKAQPMPLQSSSITSTASPVISKLDLHGTVYNIVDAVSQDRITDLSTELQDTKNDLSQALYDLDAAKNQITRLENEKSNLQSDLTRAKLRLDQIIGILIDKGIVDYTEVIE